MTPSQSQTAKTNSLMIGMSFLLEYLGVPDLGQEQKALLQVVE